MTPTEDIARMTHHDPAKGVPRFSRRFTCTLAALASAGALTVAGTASAASKVFVSGYNSDSIGVIDADGTGLAAAVPASAGLSGPYGTAVDPARGKVYWLDSDSGSKLGYANLDGSGVGFLTVVNPAGYGLAFDPTTDMLYWTPDTDDTVRRVKTDGTGEEVFIAATDWPASIDPVSPVIDLATGRLYVVDYSGTKYAYANLDGSLINGQKVQQVLADPTTCAALTGATVNQVLVDSANDAVYWIGGLRVYRSTLAGADCVAVGDPMSGSNGAALDPTSNRLFAADWTADTFAWTFLGAPAASGTYSASPAATGLSYPAVLSAPVATTPAAVTPVSPALGSNLSCGDAVWSLGNIGTANYSAPAPGRTYAWTKDGAPLAGATDSTLLVTGAGAYQCIVTAANAAGEGTSTSGVVTVAAAPEPTPQPPAPAPAPTAPAPTGAPAPAPTVNPMAPPAIAPAGDNRTRLTFRLKLSQSGRYTFILQEGATPAPLSGRRAKRARPANPGPPRVEFLAGSKIGSRTLTAASSAPVLRGAKAGQDITVVAFINGTPPANLMLNAVAVSRTGGLQGSLFPVSG